MTQHRTTANRQHRGEIPTPPRHGRVPDRVHPAMQPMQAADADPMRDRWVAETTGTQLPDRDHTVLAARDLGELHIEGCLTFLRSI